MAYDYELARAESECAAAIRQLDAADELIKRGAPKTTRDDASRHTYAAIERLNTERARVLSQLTN